jgi:aromatic ring hydroxylase
MLATGRQKLERMRDGRIVYVGAERVDDVTSHPARRRDRRRALRSEGRSGQG